MVLCSAAAVSCGSLTDSCLPPQTALLQNGNFPSFSLAGDVSARAAALADDLLTADDEEEAVPVRAMRRPIVLAAAVTSQ